jgi:hypothetical protein
MVCDWSRAERPGLGPVWALLARLSDLGADQLAVRHEGNPPHTLDLRARRRRAYWHFSGASPR